MTSPQKNHLSSLNNILTWASKVINDSTFDPELIVQTPWSNVIKINTSTKPVYLKQTPKDLFLETEVIKLLHNKCHIETIPYVIAENTQEHCFILSKCGDLTLRDYCANQLNLELMIQALNVYKDLQKATINVVDDLVTIGVADWRLDKFPSLYNDMISDTFFLTTHGLTSKHLAQLHDYQYIVKALCEKLSNYAVPECLNHSDFHDNNILYDNSLQSTTIIDLGETAINHPFFSLMAFLDTTKNCYNLSDESDIYKSLENNIFRGWLADKKYLDEAIEIVKILLPMYYLFTQKRFLDAINLPYNAKNPLSVKQHNKIKKGFSWFMNNMEGVHGQ